MAFCTATGTSRALPLPMPMPPSPSPTTVSAAKPSTRPPFTTLVTRLTAIIFSRRPSPRSSDCCILGWIFAIWFSLELQSASPRGLGERFDAPVILVAGAVESDAFDALFLRLLRDALADDLGCFLVAAALELRAYFLLERGSTGKNLVPGRRRDLGVDVRIGAMHGEPHRPDFADLEPRLARAAQPG